jgi:hypothetical protein
LPLVKNPIGQIWKKVKEHQVWSKVAADLVSWVLKATLVLAFALIGIGTATAGLHAVIDYFSLLFVWSTYVTAREYLRALLSYCPPDPMWVLLAIGGVACWMARKLMRASEAREQKYLDMLEDVHAERNEARTERDELALELRQIRQTEAAEQMEGPAPVQEILIRGLLWRCTYDAAGRAESAGAFCPICDSEIDPSRRYDLHGSPAKYTCPCGDFPSVKFDKPASHVTRDTCLEFNRRNRVEKRRFRSLVTEKVAAGVTAEIARAQAIQQIEAERQQADATGLIT